MLWRTVRLSLIAYRLMSVHRSCSTPWNGPHDRIPFTLFSMMFWDRRNAKNNYHHGIYFWNFSSLLSLNCGQQEAALSIVEWRWTYEMSILKDQRSSGGVSPRVLHVSESSKTSSSSGRPVRELSSRLRVLLEKISEKWPCFQKRKKYYFYPAANFKWPLVSMQATIYMWFTWKKLNRDFRILLLWLAAEAKKPVVVELTHEGAGLTDTDLQRVMTAALIHKKCTSLNLSQNKITAIGAAIIATSIENNEVTF